MASSKICRLSSKIHALSQKLSKKNVHVSSLPSPIKSSSLSSATTRINQSLRLPVELSSCLSLFPLHSAIASARLVSSLSVETESWGLVPQVLHPPVPILDTYMANLSSYLHYETVAISSWYFDAFMTEFDLTKV